MPITVWKGHISFGLVSIPVRLYRAARKEAVRLHHVRYAPAEPEAEVEEAEEAPPPSTPSTAVGDRRPQTSEQPPHPTLAQPEPEPDQAPGPRPHVERLQQRLITPDDEEPVKPQERAKAFEYGRDQYVVLRDEEIKRLRPRTSSTMEILSAVKLSEIDPVYFETSYYVVPDTAGEKPYALLFASLQQVGYVALAQMAMHGREHIMVIRPGRRGLLAHTMYYNDEVRGEHEFDTDVTPVQEKELHLATEFVRALATPFEPEQFRDEYRAQLRELIEAKAAKRQVVSQERPPAAAAPVVDIMEALKKSIQAAKKPAQKATAAVPSGKRKEKGQARRA
jgi:DNA end-binding protein Ku